ncbi:MAG: RNA methyltransferase [Bacteroidota bacterium]|nr:RNA methyltransferase [Bacteroidota bacterium]
MLTKADIKFVKSLNEKKERYANKLFVAEGNKLVIEILHSKISVTRIFANENWLNLNEKLVGKNIEITLLKHAELTRLSNLQSTREVIALCKIPEYELDFNRLSGLTIALDTIQDPGNLGTIIRVADWFGLNNILCSKETVDCFNPKVVQSTMGSISRVKLFYGDLSIWLNKIEQPVLAASVEGTSVHEYTFPENAVLVIGNEGIGIGTELKPLIQQNICIPRKGSAESLNAAIAAAILIDRYAGLNF